MLDLYDAFLFEVTFYLFWGLKIFISCLCQLVLLTVTVTVYWKAAKCFGSQAEKDEF